MTEDAPQLYLIAPALITASELGPRLSAVLDAHPVACLRLPGAGDETELGRIADIARDIAHARDVAVVIENHVAIARAHGLDGVHLTDGARTVRYARKELGSDAIVGAFCGALLGSIIFGIIVNLGSIPGRNDTDLLTGVEAIPGAVLGLAVVWWMGKREIRQQAQHA